MADTGSVGVAVKQTGRVGLLAAVPGSGPGEGQAAHGLVDELQLDALHLVVRTVDVECQVAQTLLRVEELGLHVGPLFLVDRTVEQ